MPFEIKHFESLNDFYYTVTSITVENIVKNIRLFSLSYSVFSQKAPRMPLLI